MTDSEVTAFRTLTELKDAQTSRTTAEKGELGSLNLQLTILRVLLERILP
jgi:hypothetical protein